VSALSITLTISEENYLKAIYHLQTGRGNVSTNALAKSLQAKPASITDMMKKLNAKGLLHYKPYYGFSLSTEGRKAALAIIRRHRLWEYFLATKLNFNWDEVHEVAEELEHVSSRKLVERLDAYLGFPEFDPHGDPIPDTKGRVKKNDSLPLSNLPLLQPAEVQNIISQSKDALAYLKQINIGVGTVLKIHKRFDFDGSIEVMINAKPVMLTETLSKNLLVKKL